MIKKLAVIATLLAAPAFAETQTIAQVERYAPVWITGIVMEPSLKESQIKVCVASANARRDSSAPWGMWGPRRWCESVYDTVVQYNQELSERRQAERQAKQALGGVRIGMTANQVINDTHWGRPKDINRTTTAYGVREQWVYNSYSYLYFKDGILVAIQN